MFMEKFVFYNTQHTAWVCNIKNREKYRYENNIKPIVISIMECTEEYMVLLKDALEYDKQTFVDMIKDEIEKQPLSIYSN